MLDPSLDHFPVLGGLAPTGKKKLEGLIVPVTDFKRELDALPGLLQGEVRFLLVRIGGTINTVQVASQGRINRAFWGVASTRLRQPIRCQSVKGAGFQEKVEFTVA